MGEKITPQKGPNNLGGYTGDRPQKQARCGKGKNSDRRTRTARRHKALADAFARELVRLTNALTRVRKELGARAKPADDGYDWGKIQDEADRLEQEERNARQ